MKAFPSHLIKQKVRTKARPLNPREAIRGSPSPWKVLAMIPTHAALNESNDSVSVLLNAAMAGDVVVVVHLQPRILFGLGQKSRELALIYRALVPKWQQLSQPHSRN
jgi:hypothetical protein